MQLPRQRVEGRLIRRYNRFLADVRLEDGRRITAHCPNSGSMLSCIEEGRRVVLSISDHPGRKYPYTLELIHSGSSWIGVHTGRTNSIVEEGIKRGVISELSGYPHLRREVPVDFPGQKSGRLDFFLDDAKDMLPCYVEVKSVTLLQEQQNRFPDAKTTRGQKHLELLIALKKSGFRAVQLYVVQRNDGEGFRPAYEIDSQYAQMLYEADQRGVEILVYGTTIQKNRISIHRRIQATIPVPGRDFSVKNKTK